MRTTVAVAAENRDPVLVAGGTAEVRLDIAQSIHGKGSPNPFVQFYASILTPELIYNELFGCRRGHFGRGRDFGPNLGMLEKARGGSIFIDDIEVLGGDVEDALERLLRTGTIRRLGETENIQVDTRLIAGTWCDDVAVLAQRIRPALYDRLTAQTVYATSAE